jgi:CRP-like cAMP-binding protein/membrane protease YdiL (CAAX protease family)
MLEDALREVALFRDLPEEFIRELAGCGNEVKLGAGARFITEAAEPDFFYLILEGIVSVSKRGDDGIDHELVRIEAPAVVGEFALFDQKPRSSSVATITPARLVAFDMIDIRRRKGLYAAILEHNARHSSNLLRGSNVGLVKALQERLAEAHKRAALGVLFVYLVTGLAFYTIGLHMLHTLEGWVPGGVRTVTISILFLFGAVTLLAMRRTGLPWAFYGLTFDGWRRSLFEGVVYSIPLVLILVAYKGAMITFNPHFEGVKLIDPWHPFLGADGQVNWWLYFIGMAAYSATVPLQELICRGGLQSALQNLLVGPRWRNVLVAVVTSNLIFATAHSHLNLKFVASVFFPGLYWGWLYSRHRSILGVTVSHIIGGVWVLYIMGTGGLV